MKLPNASSYVEYVNGSSLTTSGKYSFYCVDHAGNQSSVYTVLMDHDPPVLTCDGAEFGGKTGTGFTVNVSEKLSGWTLYIKHPGESEYRSAEGAGSYSVSTSSRDGKYYFMPKTVWEIVQRSFGWNCR